MRADSLTSYLADYGQTLIDGVKRISSPLSSENDKTPDVKLLREPMPAQWKRIMGTVAAWKAGRTGVVMSAEMGTGKTIKSIVSCHVHANGTGYRAVVICPPHLPKKWQRELELTIPNVKVRIIGKYSDVLGLDKIKPKGPEWWIMSGNKAKLSTTWVPAYVKKRTGLLHCPNCDAYQEKKIVVEGANVMVPCTVKDLEKKPTKCECGECLYQWTHQLDRWPVARLIQKKVPNAFKYLVLDEAHEAKGQNTAIGEAVGKLASVIPYQIALTGTLLNGYADSVLPMCYRLFPSKMKSQGIIWGDTMGFVKKYGRIETVETYKDSRAYHNRQSKGRGKTTNIRVRPGITPNIYGDCLMDNAVFCNLEDLGYTLPGFEEFLDEVEMDEEVAGCYKQLEAEVTTAVRTLIKKGSKGALAAMLNTLIGWPDHPYGFKEVGYTTDEGRWVSIATPPELCDVTERNKEKELVRIVKETVARGRQVWVYCEMTQKRDVQGRIQQLLKEAGLDARVLRSQNVPTCDREDWIYKNGKADVIISNPMLVQTGLDLFDRGGNHNFSTIIFYQCGYKLDTLRQASRRAYRIGQKEDCEVRYMYYAGTMQKLVIKLMSMKTQAAGAVEGKFTASGLAAMSGGEGESAAMMLAKMLVSDQKDELVKPMPVSKVEEAVKAVKETIAASTRGHTGVIELKSPVVFKTPAEPKAPAESKAPIDSGVVIEKRRLKQWTDHAAVIRTLLQNGDASGPPMLRRFGKNLARLADGDREAMTEAVKFEELEQYVLQGVS